jgi:hypothetical protein
MLSAHGHQSRPHPLNRQAHTIPSFPQHKTILVKPFLTSPDSDSVLNVARCYLCGVLQRVALGEVSAFFCEPCRHYFKSEKVLANHLRTKTHEKGVWWEAYNDKKEKEQLAHDNAMGPERQTREYTVDLVNHTCTCPYFVHTTCDTDAGVRRRARGRRWPAPAPTAAGDSWRRSCKHLVQEKQRADRQKQQALQTASAIHDVWGSSLVV